MVYKINQINLNINQNWRTQLLDDSFGVLIDDVKEIYCLVLIDR